jgi:entericidin B
MEKTMKKTRMTIVALLAAGALAACQTVEGAGRDIQAAGSAITETSQEAQR